MSAENRKQRYQLKQLKNTASSKKKKSLALEGLATLEFFTLLFPILITFQL